MTQITSCWTRCTRTNTIPDFLVDKIKDELQKVIDLLESGETDTEVIQETLDEAVCGINDLQDEFYENDSEIETVARLAQLRIWPERI